MDQLLSSPRSLCHSAVKKNGQKRNRDTDLSLSSRSRSRSESPEGRKRRGGRVGMYIEKERRRERERWLQSGGGRVTTGGWGGGEGGGTIGETRQEEEQIEIELETQPPDAHGGHAQNPHPLPSPGSVSFLGLHPPPLGFEYAKSETCATIGSEKSSVVDETEFTMLPPENRDRGLSFSAEAVPPTANLDGGGSNDSRDALSESSRPPSEILEGFFNDDDLSARSFSPGGLNKSIDSRVGVLGSDTLSCGGSLREEEVSSNASTMKSRGSKRSNVY
ncbi:hypothetical protein TrLO_g4933 [Triparma laevis f. longispina]|uniref:Uncharacterized protein n=1 Tax=Triparma laevis f. longispina TaxID=1714387 RepID=A0A9W7C960_9STRA|nr:hypothetical protein TrLO_g4933 [Triparma laevis f. longispina]